MAPHFLSRKKALSHFKVVLAALIDKEQKHVVVSVEAHFYFCLTGYHGLSEVVQYHVVTFT